MYFIFRDPYEDKLCTLFNLRGGRSAENDKFS